MIVRLYGLALHALPRRLRRKHGAAMVALFRRELERARLEGRGALVRTAWLGVQDVLVRGVTERTRRARSGEREPGGRGDHVADRGWEGVMESWWQDLTFAVRSFVRAPRFAVVAVLTLGLGIGSSTAVFTVLDGVVLRPLPFPEPERFVHLAWDHGRGPVDALTGLQLRHWTENTRSFEAVAAYRSFTARVQEDDRPVGLGGLRVSEEFLTAVGWDPVLGRGFNAADDVPDGPDVVILSDGLWRERFDAAPDVVGRTLRIADRVHTVIGVLPPEFEFPQVSSEPQLLVPLRMRVDPADEGENWEGIARLAPGVTLEAARADVARLYPAFAAAYPDHAYGDGAGMSITSFRALHVGSGLQTALSVAMAAVAFVLLIACANVANLLLARAAQRRREIALRAALGAPRGRIARSAVLEGLVLALASGGLGVLLARWGVDALLRLSPVRFPRMDQIGVDWRVIAFAFSVALVTGVVFGGVAAIPALRARLAGALKDGARGATGSGRGRQGLLAAQAALSMVLLVISGLFVASLAGLRGVDKGFAPEGVVAVRIPLRADGYGDAERVAELVRRVGEEIRGALPGADVTAASNLPLERGLNVPVSIGGRPDDWEGAIQWRAVSPEYFETLGIELVRGRAFSDADVAGGTPVVIVNEAFARRYFPDSDPIGQRVEIGRFRGEWIDASFEGPGAEIVGIAADIRELSLRADAGRTVYVPWTQAHYGLATALNAMPLFMIRPPAQGAVTRSLARELLQNVDPGLPEPVVLPLGDVVTASLAEERFNAWFLSMFAGIALSLTAFGIYGVLAYTVRQRRREIGIRIALGAGGARVARLVGRQGMAPVAVGLVAGAAASLWLSRPVADMLWGVKPTDPLTITTVAAFLMVVAGLASVVPAREALAVDPVRVLTED